MKFPPTFVLRIAGVEVRLWRIITPLAIFFLILTFVLISLTSCAERRFETFKKALRDSGYNTSLAEMAPPSVPAKENAAPYYKAAFLLLSDPETLAGVYDGQPFGSMDPEDRIAIERFLEKNRQGFEIIRYGRSRPRCRYDRDYSEGIHLRMPELAPSRKIAEWLSLCAQAEAVAGRHDEARNYVLDICALGDAYKDEPIPTAQLVRLSLISMAASTIRFCNEANASQEDYTKWLAILPPPECLNGAIELAMRGELATLVQLVNDPHEHLLRYGQRDWSTRFGMIFLGFHFKLSSIRSLEILRRLAECCRRPYPESRMEALAINPPSDSRLNYSFDLVEMLMPAVRRMLDRQAITKANLAVVRAGIEHEIYYLKNGKYPDSVSVTDPCTGKPLHYDHSRGIISSNGPPNATHAHNVLEGLVWNLRRH